MSGITVYNSSNVPQTHLGHWQSSSFSNQSNLAIRQNDRMIPIDDYAFGTTSLGPNSWSTANQSSNSWSAWRTHWFSQLGTIQSDRYLVTVSFGAVYDYNFNYGVGDFGMAFDLNAAFGRANETTPFGTLFNERFSMSNTSMNSNGSNRMFVVTKHFYPLNNTGYSNFRMGENYKIRVRTRIPHRSSVWFRNVRVDLEPI